MNILIFIIMLIIKTTDSQILISRDGKGFEGLPKNSLRYQPDGDILNFYWGNDSSVFIWEYWTAGITINGTTVTKENVNTALEPLFFESKQSFDSQPENEYDACIYLKKK